MLRGEAGVGNTALLDALVEAVGNDVRIERVMASETEVELTYAGLHALATGRSRT